MIFETDITDRNPLLNFKSQKRISVCLFMPFLLLCPLVGLLIYDESV